MPVTDANDGTQVGTLATAIAPGPNLVSSLATSALSTQVAKGAEVVLYDSTNGQRKVVYASATAATSATTIAIAGAVFSWAFSTSTTINIPGAQRLDPEGDVEVSANATAD